MARFITLSVFLFTALFLSLVYTQSGVHAQSNGAPASHKAVVVELFTSEGCSSCPPADALLGQLRDDKALNGIDVIPLGFHVDYWNYLGWQDRFSSHAFSQRQEQYASKLALNGAYTPQMIVNGTDQFVGSNSGQAHAAITRAAAAQSLATIDLSAAQDKLHVNVRSSGKGDGDVLLAVTEDNLTNKIGAGENGGRVLRHSAVVRDFRVLGKLNAGNFQSEVPLKLDKDWKRADLRVVVFVQDAGSTKILGAAAVKLQ
jgi:hypothetical protein